MFFAHDSGGQQFGLYQSGISSLGLTRSHSCSYGHLVVPLGLGGLGWPHSHGWQLVLASGWASLSMWSLILKEAGSGMFT